MKATLWICTASLLVCAPAFGQPTQPDEPPPPGPPRFQLHIAPMAAIPTGTFGDHVGTSAGVAGGFRYRVEESPVWVGVRAAGFPYGSETRTVPLSLTLPDVPVDVTTRNVVVQIHGLVRVQPATGRVRPYVEGLAGFGYLYTRTSVDFDPDADFDAGTFGSINFDDWTVSVGGGVGTLVQLYANRDFGLHLDVALRYLRGGEADYLTEGDLIREIGTVRFDTTRSRTDLVSFTAGVSFEF